VRFAIRRRAPKYSASSRRRAGPGP